MAGSFAVDPPVLDAAGARLEELRTTTRAARDYVETHLADVSVGTAGVFFAALSPTLREIRFSVVDLVQHVGDLCDGTGHELVRAAAAYRSMDAGAAARLDRVYALAGWRPGTEGLSEDRPPGIPHSSDGRDLPGDPTSAHDPSSCLTPPVAADPIPDLVHGVLDVLSVASPTDWVWMALEHFAHADPFGLVVGWIDGDWAHIQRAGLALERLADWTSAVADVLRAASADLRVAWHGRAADACFDYLDRLVAAVESQAAPLRAIGGELRGVALGMRHFTDGAITALQGLYEIALLWAISAAATAAASGTGIGGLVGGAATLSLTMAGRAKWAEIISAYDQMLGFTQTAAGALLTRSAPMYEFRAHPLPAGAYDHLGV